MTAIISPCGLFRYRLERRLGGDGVTVAFIMVNPSTADGTQDDPTIRKCIGFAKKLGGGTLIVGNKFAYRATDVHELRGVRDPIGPHNEIHLREIIFEADVVIAAWGSLNKLPETLRSRWKDVARLADERSQTLSMLGTNADGHPKHPLMVGYDAEIAPWPVPWFPNRDGAALRERREEG